MKAPTHVASPRPVALTQREMLSAFVEKSTRTGATEHSSVTLKTNARGEVQIDVTVRTGETPEVATVDDAAAKARVVFDLLRSMYPLEALKPGGGNGGES